MGSGKGGQCCAKTIVVLVNLVVGLIGFVLLAAGIFIFVGQPVYETYTNLVRELILGVVESFQLVSQNDSQDLDIAAFLESVAIVFVIIGCILLVLSLMGCCGSCCSNRCIMIMYTTVLIVVLMIQVVLVGLVFGQILNETHLRNQLNNTLVETYAGVDCYEPECLIYNTVMMEFDCCGLTGYEDFQYYKKWENVRTFKDNVTRTLATPLSCCKLGDFPNYEPSSDDCFEDPLSTEHSNYNVGCYEKMTTYLDEYMNIAKGVAIGIIVVQCLLCLMAVYITYKTPDGNKVGVDEDEDEDDGHYVMRRRRGVRGNNHY